MLDNPVIIQRPGQYRITLAQQLNRAQNFFEQIVRQFTQLHLPVMAVMSHLMMEAGMSVSLSHKRGERSEGAKPAVANQRRVTVNILHIQMDCLLRILLIREL